MRPLLCTLLIACQTPVVLEPPAAEPVAQPDPWDVTPAQPAPPAGPAAPAAPATIAMPPPTNEPLVEPTSHGLVNAMPASAIAMVAITDDGRAAVTADFSHSARIWPTLDGKREPVVVTMRPPAALALARTDSRLVIGALDPAGQLEIVVTKASGESERRLAVESARPFVAIHAVPDGFLVLDDERAVHAVGADGVPSAPLVADAEQHITALAVRSGRVLAVIEQDGKVHGRWIELDPLRWGATTPALPFTGDRVALSPDGKRIAGTTTSNKRIVVIDLATGRQVGRAADVDLADPQLRPIAFIDAKTLALIDVDQTVSFWDGVLYGERGTSHGVTAGGDGLVLAAHGTALQLVSPRDEPQFVGYRVGGPQMLLPAGDGFLASDQTKLVELDRHLKTRKVHELGQAPGSAYEWTHVRIVDARHVLATAYVNAAYAMYMIDLDAAEAKLVSANGFPQDYQPASRLLLYRTQHAFEVRHLDPQTHTFGTPTRFEYDPSRPPLMVLLDPARAGGNVLAIIEATATTATLKLVGALHPERPADPYDITSQRTVELTERWWETVGDLSKLVEPAMLPPTRIKSPDGKHAVELRGGRIRLFSQAGASRWTVPAHAASAVMWTPAGRLLASGAGVAELDLTSGALLERQCGWRFGRWSTPPEGFGPTNLCDAR